MESTTYLHIEINDKHKYKYAYGYIAATGAMKMTFKLKKNFSLLSSAIKNREILQNLPAPQHINI